MYIAYSKAGAEVPAPDVHVSACPYRKATSAYCSASVMPLSISKRQDASYCGTENFDHCPVFLAKVLRSN